MEKTTASDPYDLAAVRLPRCDRCGHPPGWHRMDDALNQDPTDPAARFRCIGYDCERDGPPHSGVCDCPDYSYSRDAIL